MIGQGRKREGEGRSCGGTNRDRHSRGRQRGIRFWNRAVASGTVLTEERTVLAGSLIKIFTRRDAQESRESPRLIRRSSDVTSYRRFRYSKGVPYGGPSGLLSPKTKASKQKKEACRATISTRRSRVRIFE